MKKTFTWEQYGENIKKVGCCPCGYLIHDELAKYTHWSLHIKNREITTHGELKITDK